MKDYLGAIAGFRQTYFRVHEILKNRTEFFRPLNDAEMAVCVRFGNRYYDSRGISDFEFVLVKAASALFNAIRAEHPEITDCNPKDPENAFSISAIERPDGKRTAVNRTSLTESWLNQNESPDPNFSESGDIAQE